MFIQLIMSINPYEILHLEEDATYDQIKERYRHLTRSLHPDKQPIQNYTITKRLFEQIDQAYKSISSPLRRHLFRQYGLPALKILQEVPDYFEEFDVEVLTPDQISKLKQLMIYLLYEREASFQADKTKFITKMVMNITKTIKGKPKNSKKHSKRNYHLPEIQNCTFEYEMVLPEVAGFANTFAISQTTANIKNDPKSVINFAFSMARRLYWNYMLALQFNFSTQQSSCGAVINRICENNLTIAFTPLSFTNWKLNPPKIAIEKSLQDYMISTSLDTSGSISLEYSDSSQKKIGKSLKLYMQNGSMGVIPRLQVQVAEGFRLFGQISAAIEAQGKEGINLRPSLTYGYRLVITEDLKLQLASCLGSPNYLQISFISSKFRVGIPLITAEVDLVKFQLIKVVAMVLTYAAVEGFKFKRRREVKAQQRLLKDNQTRLVELKREINRILSDVELSAQTKREMEIKYNGLIIIRAFFGEQTKISKITSKLKKELKFPFLGMREEKRDFQRRIIDLEQIIFNMELPVGGFHDETENVTSLLQNEVVGGQLVNFNLNNLRRYSPTIEPSLVPSIFIVYIERGQLKNIQAPCTHLISLGTKKQGISSKIGKFLQGLIGYLV